MDIFQLDFYKDKTGLKEFGKKTISFKTENKILQEAVGFFWSKSIKSHEGILLTTTETNRPFKLGLRTKSKYEFFFKKKKVLY